MNFFLFVKLKDEAKAIFCFFISPFKRFVSHFFFVLIIGIESFGTSSVIMENVKPEKKHPNPTMTEIIWRIQKSKRKKNIVIFATLGK